MAYLGPMSGRVLSGPAAPGYVRLGVIGVDTGIAWVSPTDPNDSAGAEPRRGAVLYLVTSHFLRRHLYARVLTSAIIISNETRAARAGSTMVTYEALKSYTSSIIFFVSARGFPCCLYRSRMTTLKRSHDLVMVLGCGEDQVPGRACRERRWMAVAHVAAREEGPCEASELTRRK